MQAYYSLVSRNAEREIMPMTQAHGLALTVWSPLAGGFLTGKIDRGTPSAPGRRATGADFPPVDREKAYDVIDAARAVAARHGATVPQVALTGQDLAELGEVSKQPPACPNWIQEMYALCASRASARERSPAPRPRPPRAAACRTTRAPQV